MFKQLVTILFIITMAGNTLAILPASRRRGWMRRGLFAAARQDGPTATISAICCLTECQESAETTTLTVTSTVLKQQQLSGPVDCAPAISPQSFYLQYAKFPVSPTRFLHGYIEPLPRNWLTPDLRGVVCPPADKSGSTDTNSRLTRLFIRDSDDFLSVK